MLGYIVPDKPELKVREYELYRAYYCGICKSLGRRYGQLPRFALSYDAVFLALIVSCFDDKPERLVSERCVAHPLKKRAMVHDQDALDYAADIILFLTYYKMKDDLTDAHAIRGAAGMTLLGRSFRKWKAAHPEKSLLMEERLEELRRLEAENCESVDRAAEPFAKLMEAVCLPDWLEDSPCAAGLREIGYHTGRWIYLLDAWDDLEEDEGRCEYNPLLCRFGFSEGKETMTMFRNRIREKVEDNLFFSLARLAEVWSGMKQEKNRDLIDNIIYFGLRKKTESVLKKGLETDAESI